MSFQQALKTAIKLAPLAALANDVRAVMHKSRYPMAEILAKVPGDSLAARARAIGVSRQTMYVWAQERFRPSGEQAAIIAKLTGVPLAQIGQYQDGVIDEEPAAETSPPVRSLSAGVARLRTKRIRMAAKQRKRRHG